jgi:hypothetical protein
MLSYFFSIFIVISLFYSLLILLPALTIYLEKINLKLPLVNSLGHFILMNFDLFLGYFKYISASNESAWEPPKRNV